MFGLPLVVIVVLGQLSAAGLKLQPGDGRYETQIRAMKSADPAKDVERAITNGDTRFVGWEGGWGPIVPGAPRRAELSPDEVRCILQGGCVIWSKEELRLRHAAYDYAAAYNEILLRKMPSLATTRPGPIAATRPAHTHPETLGPQRPVEK
jgi:hypothetical protein